MKTVRRSKLKEIQFNLDSNGTIEFHNNAVSRFIAQYGKCYLTGKELEPENVIAIHIEPKENGGTDRYSNVVIIDKSIAEAVISEKPCTLPLTKTQKEKLNRLRRARKMILIK